MFVDIRIFQSARKFLPTNRAENFLLHLVLRIFVSPFPKRRQNARLLLSLNRPWRRFRTSSFQRVLSLKVLFRKGFRKVAHKTITLSSTFERSFIFRELFLFSSLRFKVYWFDFLLTTLVVACLSSVLFLALFSISWFSISLQSFSPLFSLTSWCSDALLLLSGDRSTVFGLKKFFIVTGGVVALVNVLWLMGVSASSNARLAFDDCLREGSVELKTPFCLS